METNFNNDSKTNSNPEGMKQSGQKASILGVVVVIAGLLLLARNTGFLDFSVSRIIFSWEMLLIVIGLVNILWRRSFWSGVSLIAVGVFFLLVNFYHMPFSTWQIFLPALIILLGLQMIFGTALCRKKRDGRIFSNDVSSNDFFEDVAVFGGGERKIVTPALKGGRIIAVFGGSKIDLSHSNIAAGEKPVLEVVAVFGGSSLLVPSDWNVKFEVFNIFGGYADKRVTSQVNYEKTLLIKGIAIFGGGDMRSF